MSKIIHLPPVDREEVLASAGIHSGAHWPEFDRDALSRDADHESTLVTSTTRTLSKDIPLLGRRRRVRLDDPSEREFLYDGGWSIAEGRESGGVVAHRGAVHPEEYVDTDALRAKVEHAFGFSYDQVHAVYRQGPKSAPTLELRARIDARVLELSRSGANIALLAKAFGLAIQANGSSRAFDSALERAQAAE